MYPKLKILISKALVAPIEEERNVVLHQLATYIHNKLKTNQTARLNFICTHNSRRSQFAQIWAQLAAAYFKIPVISSSAGVEVTAFNERAVASIQRFGFEVQSKGIENPHYTVSFDAHSKPLLLFSKHFDEEPISDPFAAVMTCAHADENCPFIPAAEARIALRYEDPKVFDNTPLEATKYDERSFEIAAELFYVFKRVKEHQA